MCISCLACFPIKTDFLVITFRFGGMLKPPLAHKGRSQRLHMAPPWNELRSKNAAGSADSKNHGDKRKHERARRANSTHLPKCL